MEQSRVADELLERLPPEQNSWDMMDRAQWLEYTTLLSGYILSAQGDRMLMAHSVEGRFPFLDCNLVDFANSILANHKLFSLDEKHLLKKAFGDLIPLSIMHRHKQPYRASDAASFFLGNRLEWVEDLASEEAIRKSGLFDGPAVRRLIEKSRRTGGVRMSNTDNMRLVGILSTLLAYHWFIRGDGTGESDEIPPQPFRYHTHTENRR
jgi:asparagine synthase (glutamine-hydrolysing)